ncbi:hypothetical protein [Corynebacterium neomassiliense]|uniref:hypothetical protein n=1 Tax=Corynebacterium neomassiliense TaxID=2079482 RepID=UPI001031A4AE|nr:hypothetical protein [Corynebacterium neomassiliense]
MSRYTLYRSLGLDRSRDPQQLAAQLDQWLKMPDQDALRLEELRVARAILGDPWKRTEYDRRIDDPAAAPMSLAELTELAAWQQYPATPVWSQAAEPAVAPTVGQRQGYSAAQVVSAAPATAGRGAAAALGVLFLFLVLSLFLNWKKFTSSFSYEGVDFDYDIDQKGYGRLLADLAADGQSLDSTSEVLPFYLSGILLSLVLVLVGSGLLAMGKAPRSATVLAGVGGLVAALLAVLNMAANNMDDAMDYSEGAEDVVEAMLRDGELSTGLGCFIALATGILIIVAAGSAFVLVRRQQLAQSGYECPGNSGFGDHPDAAPISSHFASGNRI